MKKKKVVISGYYGFGNLGDEAILSAIAHALNEKIANLSISVIAGSDKTYLEKELDIKYFKRTSLFTLLKEILSADLFISGGGGLLQDVSGVSTIIYYLSLVKLAKFFGKKTLFYAQGFGPVNSDRGKQIVKQIANGVDLITVRDNESAELFRAVGVTKPPIIVTADPVIALKGSGAESIFRKEGLESKGSFDLAISVRPWETKNGYLEPLAQVADRMHEKFNARIIVIPFQLSQDLEVCMELASRMHCDPYVVKNGYTPEEMISFIGSMDMLLGMRLHSLIFASSYSVPMGGIIYDPKVEIFAKSIGAPHWNLEELNPDQIFNELVELYENREEHFKKQKQLLDPLHEKSLQTAEIASELLNGIKVSEIVKRYGGDR